MAESRKGWLYSAHRADMNSNRMPECPLKDLLSVRSYSRRAVDPCQSDCTQSDHTLRGELEDIAMANLAGLAIARWWQRLCGSVGRGVESFDDSRKRKLE